MIGTELAVLEAAAAAPACVHADNDSTLVKLWLEGRPSTTARAYQRDAAALLAHVGKPLQAATLGDLQEYARSLAGLAPASVKRRLAVVKSLCGFGHRLGYLAFDVGRPLHLPALRDRLAERIVSEAEVARLLELEPSARNHAFLRVLYGTGLRISEAVSLCWRDLKPAAKGGGGQATVFGKGGKTRVVLLPGKLWRQVAALRQGAGPDAPVFRSAKGGALDASAAHRVVKAAAKRAGLPAEFSAHWCRHAHASHALDRGAPVHVVQASLGHGSLATTTRYSHARPDSGSSQYLPE